ncbi:MAG: hypothetical protein ACRDOB_22755 [Streptosporangiaceae bacterium]
MTPAISAAMHELERVADEHSDALLTRHDVDAALAVMAADPTVRHLPSAAGASGREALYRFYAEDYLPHLPGDLARTRISRTVGRFRLVDETLVRFRHDRPLPWLLPGIEPTYRWAEVTTIVITDFDRLRLRGQHIHWDHATLLTQLGLVGHLPGVP